MALDATAIAENYRRVEGQVAAAAEQAGRDPASVRLVVVTKTHPVEAIEAVVNAGARWIGESYIEEALPKLSRLEGLGIAWHMIGHVQSRKGPLAAGKFDLIHSVDTLKLARRLDRACQEQGISQKVLLECNVSGEAAKSGFAMWDEESIAGAVTEIEAIIALPALAVQGLMTVPPLFDDPEQARPYFRRLRELSERLADRFAGISFRELSMGMSGDFMTAIEEGATWVRVGTAIMGPRTAE